MNIAAGVPLERGKYLGEFSPQEYLSSLMKQKFNGYVCACIRGRTGLEEGVLVFHNGEIASVDYEYYRYNRNFMAADGLARCLNALLAKSGIVDSFSLSPYQVQLVLTLNEDCNLKEKVNEQALLKMMPRVFNQSYEDALTPIKSAEVSREDLLKKYGITSLVAPGATRTELIKTAKSEGAGLGDLMKGE